MKPHGLSLQHSFRVVVGAFLAGLVCATASGCDGNVSTSNGQGGQDGGAGDGAGSWPDGLKADLQVCAQSSVSATMELKPVDIIVVIDNSGSMSDEIHEVEEQINKNFASIIDAAQPPIDYRVIMLSKFGPNSDESICIAAPLGGIADADQDGHCDTLPSQPVNTARFFHHSTEIQSHDSLCNVLEQLTTADDHGFQPNGYGEVLRPEAFKFLLVVTDDSVRCDSYDDNDVIVSDGRQAAQAFDQDLLAQFPEHFGQGPDRRNYTFWSIVSLAPYQPSASKPYGEPHPPDETLAPLISDVCSPSAQAPGTGYQALSVMTGGYRYPTCGLDYTDIFRLMAQGVIEGASVACEYLIPEPPEGEVLDLDTVQVRYSSAGQEIEVFNPTPSLTDCAADSHQFYIDGDHLRLCPNTCELVQADEDAEIAVLYGCKLIIE